MKSGHFLNMSFYLKAWNPWQGNLSVRDENGLIVLTPSDRSLSATMMFYPDRLSEQEIYHLISIVQAVIQRNEISLSTIHWKMFLNSNTIKSRNFVRKMLNSNYSVEKIFLSLVSGSELVDHIGVLETMKLVKQKAPPSDELTSKLYYSIAGLRFWLIPGVYSGTKGSIYFKFDPAAMVKYKKFADVALFISTDQHPDLTLRDFFEKSDKSSIRLPMLKDMVTLLNILTVLTFDEIAEDVLNLSHSQMKSFLSILDSVMVDEYASAPYILRPAIKRSIALNGIDADSNYTTEDNLKELVLLRPLNKSERDAIENTSELDRFCSVRDEYGVMGNYAVNSILSEIALSFGVNRATEVFKFAVEYSCELYTENEIVEFEALLRIYKLMMEVFKPENEQIPFEWIVQTVTMDDVTDESE